MHCERRASVIGRRHVDSTSVRRNDSLGDVETETEAGRAARWRLARPESLERSEEAGDRRCGNSGTVVVHAKYDLVSRTLDRHDNRRVRRAMLHRVAEQIREQLAD